MSKWLRLESARNNKVYIEIVTEALIRLTERGSFSKDGVLEATGYDVIGDIRWDYVVRIIEEDHDTKLMAMAESYFKRHATDSEITSPEKYIAHGHGKRTAGYAIIRRENGHLVTHVLKIKEDRAIGCVKAANRTLEVGRTAGVEQLINRRALPLAEPPEAETEPPPQPEN